MDIVLGNTYTDKITGFAGVATGHATYISGCNQTLLAPPVDKDGASRDACWFDDQRLLNTEKAAITLDNGKTPGCDKPAPIR